MNKIVMLKEMTIKQKIIAVISGGLVATFLAGWSLLPVAAVSLPDKIAQTTETTESTENSNNSENESDNKSKDANSGGKGECAGEKTDFFACGGADGQDAIVSIIKVVITIASVGVGVVAVGGIVFGAIIYASAQDNQEQIHKAILIIRSVVIGLVLYVFMVAIINFLVPGGVFTAESDSSDSAESSETSEQSK